MGRERTSIHHVDASVGIPTSFVASGFTIHNSPFLTRDPRVPIVSKTDSSCNKNERFRILDMAIAL